MIKFLAIGFLDGIDATAADSWYFDHHSREAVRFFGPWMRRYESYRAFETPKEHNERFGLRGGRVSEEWFDSVACWQEADPFGRPWTPSPFDNIADAPRAVAVLIPAMPTEDFLGTEPTPEQKPIMRWVFAFKYPDGVSLEEGEKWFLDVHSQEAKRQPGLLKYVSHRTLEGLPFPSPWVRVVEMWYADINTWRKANLDSPPRYTQPVWGGDYPFVDMAGTFVDYEPDIDFLNDHRHIPQ